MILFRSTVEAYDYMEFHLSLRDPEQKVGSDPEQGAKIKNARKNYSWKQSLVTIVQLHILYIIMDPAYLMSTNLDESLPRGFLNFIVFRKKESLQVELNIT